MKRILILLVSVATCSVMALAQSLDFVNTDANHIKMNGDNWARLRNQIADMQQSECAKFKILQIGDSHIQADFSASVVRRTLQNTFGDGGRGCIAALRLAGTNQPVDYRLSTDAAAGKRSRLLAKGWEAGMGVTGVAVSYADPNQRLHISTDAESGGFSSLTLLHANGPGYASAMIGDSLVLGVPDSPFATRYNLYRNVDSVTVATSFDSSFYGAYLLNSQRGVVFNAIGNNGACYYHYLTIPDFAKQTEIFAPSLIVLSMGTNEAYGSYTDQEIYSHIDSLVTILRQVHPRAKFLLTTPMECQKKMTRTVLHKRRRRGKTRRVRRRVTSFVVNRRVAEVREVILRYGVEKHVPVWDLYEIAGGAGASDKWLDNGLMNPRDHVHCLKSGYELRGSLLSDALLEQLQKQEN